MKATTSSRSDSTLISEAWLAIWGMYCPDCQARVDEALRRLPGVLEVEVDWRWMGARVEHLPCDVNTAELVACVNAVDSRAGFPFWATAGPEVAEVLRQSWQLRSLRRTGVPAQGAGRSPISSS